MGVSYCTREQVKASLDIAHTARSDGLIDRYMQSSARSIESQMKRRFYPEIKTVTKDWPNYQYAESWKLYLNQHDLISLTTMTSGGVAIQSADRFLRPDDGPPFTRIEIDLASAATLGVDVTHQRSVSLLGLFGYDLNESIAGELNAGINDSTTTIVIKPVNNVLNVGVGSLIKINDERMLVTGRTMSDVSQNTQGTLAKEKSAVTLAVETGSAFGIDEVILVDSERMRVVDIAGNNLTVERAFDGSILAAHSSGVDIYSLRTYNVTRAALGTTADSHNSNDDVYVHDYPSLINSLNIAETVVALEQNASAYARVVGAGENARESSGKGLQDLRQQAWAAHGRKARKAAI